MYQKSGFVVLDDYSEEVCTWLARQAGVPRELYIRDLLQREMRNCDASNNEMTIESLYKRMNFLFSAFDERIDMLFDHIKYLSDRIETDDEDNEY